MRGISAFALRDPSFTRHFTSGYRAERLLRPGYRERYRIYQLMNDLGFWEYGHRKGVWFQEGQRFRPFSEHAVEQFPPFEPAVEPGA